jgi:hypothetical protein
MSSQPNPHPLQPSNSQPLLRRVQQRPHRCPGCGADLTWEARSRVEQYAWDYFQCPEGCGRFFLQSGTHHLQGLD